MLWFFLSIVTALSVAVRDLSVKIFKEMTPLEIAGLELSWSLPLMAAGFFLVPVPQLDNVFWLMFIISLPLNLLAYFLYLYAIKLSPLSLTVPFLSFTPAFMILTGLITLNESINLWGGMGIMLIVSGSYILNLDQAGKGLWRPLINITSEKGSWLMLITALLFSFAAVIGKKAMLHSSALFFSYSFFLAFNLTALAGLFLLGKINLRLILSARRRGAVLGGLLFTHITCHGLAIAISTAVYMVAVKRSSILFTVLLSFVFLKEKNIKIRGLGTLLMFIGILLITILGT